MKTFYFNCILLFLFFYNSSGEARPHLPPLTARPWLHCTPTVVASLKIWKRLILKKLLPLPALFQHFRFRIPFRFQPLLSKRFRFLKKLTASIASASTSLVGILAYGHECWVMTERVRSQVQPFKMRFLRKIKRVTLFNKVRGSEIRKSLNIEPLLLRIKRSQLRWFVHVSIMPQERLPKQALLAKANGRRPVERPRTSLYGPITLRILDGIASDFTQAK